MPGNTITIIGTNFDVAPGATRVELGNVIAPTTVASTTSLSAVVPLGATSNTKVVTPLGISAASTQLFIPPTGACAEYETPIRPVINGTAVTINVATAGKKAVLLIAGTAGQALSLQFSNFAPSAAGTGLSYTVYDTANLSIASGQLSTTAASLHVPALSLTGTYAVVLAWNAASVTGTATARLETNAVLSTAGIVRASSSGTAGQSLRLSFNATAGQDWLLDIGGLTMSTGGQYLSYQIKRADGQVVASGNCYLSGGYDCDKPIYGLTAGTHTIVFTPQPAGVTASFNLRSWASSRVTGAVTIGTANTYTSTVPGQMVVKTFNGTAGQQLGLSLSNFTSSVAGAQLYAIVNKPDGNNLLFSYFTASQTTPTP